MNKDLYTVMALQSRLHDLTMHIFTCIQYFPKWMTLFLFDLYLLKTVELHLSLCVRKPTIWVPTRSDTNRAVQSQKMARGWKFWI